MIGRSRGRDSFLIDRSVRQYRARLRQDSMINWPERDLERVRKYGARLVGQKSSATGLVLDRFLIRFVIGRSRLRLVLDRSVGRLSALFNLSAGQEEPGEYSDTERVEPVCGLVLCLIDRSLGHDQISISLSSQSGSEKSIVKRFVRSFRAYV